MDKEKFKVILVGDIIIYSGEPFADTSHSVTKVHPWVGSYPSSRAKGHFKDNTGALVNNDHKHVVRRYNMFVCRSYGYCILDEIGKCDWDVE